MGQVGPTEEIIYYLLTKDSVTFFQNLVPAIETRLERLYKQVTTLILTRRHKKEIDILSTNEPSTKSTEIGVNTNRHLFLLLKEECYPIRGNKAMHEEHFLRRMSREDERRR